MVSYEHKVKNIYLGSPYNEGQPLIPGDYTLLRGPCDEGFHVPLQQERQAIKDAGITSNIYLHIPLASCRNTNGVWNTASNTAYLWSSTPITEAGYRDSAFACDYDSYIYPNKYQKRTLGNNIRAFRNTPIIPDQTRTEIVAGKIRYNSDLGLISVLVGTNQYITLQDKNVGATVVWNDGDTLTNANRGKYFQWGNNYGFTYGSTGDTSSTKVDASGYGPSNPYSSSTFITGSDRSSVQNDNLRGYTDFNS